MKAWWSGSGNPPETTGVVEYNPKYTNALTFTGISIAAIGALGLGKLIPANETSHKGTVEVAHGMLYWLGKPKVPKGAEHTDKTTNTD